MRNQSLLMERTKMSATGTNPASDVKPLTVTVHTARKISGLGNTTIWKLIKERKLEAVYVGRRTLVTVRSLEQLLSPQDNSLPRPKGRTRKVQSEARV